MQFLFLIVAVLMAAGSSQTGAESGKGACKHSCFTQVKATFHKQESDTMTHISLRIQPAMEVKYRFIGDGKEVDRTGSTDSTGTAMLWLEEAYKGEYFIELKAVGYEPLMLEAARLKGNASYGIDICLARGTQLQRYKYLGENKNNTGVLESLN